MKLSNLVEKLLKKIGKFVKEEKITTITEDEGSAEDFAKQIDDLLKKHFPRSKTWAKFSRNISESIYIRLAIGQKSDWSGGIIDNAPVEYGAIVFGIKDGKTTERMSLESSRGASVTIKPPEGSHYAFGRVKVPTRKITGNESKILKAVEKVLINLKSATKKNISNLSNGHEWVKKYV